MSFPSHGVIITAAGNSSRFNSSRQTARKKEFLLLDDRTVLYHAAQPYFNLPGLKVVVVTHPEGKREETESALDNLLFATSVPVLLIQGGATRQESVRFALETIKNEGPAIDYVMIHDGARPWVTEKIIISTLAMATVFGGAAPVLQIHDAIKRLDDMGRIAAHIDRSGMVTIQTPQAFRFPMILEAHQRAISTEKPYVDDTEIFTDFGGMVGTCEGDPENRKITLESDLVFVEERP